MDDARQAAVLATEAKIVAATKAPEPEAVPVVVPEAPAPEAPPAIEPPAAIAHEDDDEYEDSAASDNGADPTAPRKNKGVGKRINELTREKHEERRARYEAEQRAAYLEQQLQQYAQPQRPSEPTPTQGKPTLEQFGYDQEAYTEALTDWKVQSRFQELQQRQQQAQQQQRVADTLNKFQERVAKVDPDEWQAAVQANPPTSPVMLELIAESEVGPQIGIYLAKHWDEALTISRLPPMQQAVAMGRLETKLQSAPPSAPRPVSPVTRAPTPPPPIPAATGATARLGGIEDHIAVVQAQRKKKLFG